MSLDHHLPAENADQTGLLPLCDPQSLTPLTSVLEKKQVVELIKVCLADAQEKTDLIIHAASVEKWDDVATLAHDIKSTAGQIGASRLQNLATLLESRCRKTQTDQGPQLVAAFKEAAQLTLETYSPNNLNKIIALAKSAEV